MEYTSLGLGGVPRAGVLYDDSVQGASRPDGGQFTELGLSGAARSPQQFDAKAPGSIPPRPDGEYTELGLTGWAGPIATYLPKRSNVGIYGSVELTVTPQGTITIGRRYYVPTDLVLSIRPMGAVITVAHTNLVQGSVSVSLKPQAGQLKYTRFGANNAMQGNAGVSVTPFGFVKYRTWRRLAGVTTTALVPRATLKYTAAPIRNLHVAGAVRVRVTPQGTVAHQAHGVPYAVTGTNTVSVTPAGRVSVVRQTTYVTYGRVTVSLTPQGTITKGTGEPIAYHVSGSTILSVVPQATMGLQPGTVEQHAVIGSVQVHVRPFSRVTVVRAPTITPLTRRGGRRRFVRIFR